MRPTARPRWRWWIKLRRNPVGMLGAILVALAMLVAVGAPLMAPREPTKQNLRSRMMPPAWHAEGDVTFFLGTDQLGRDLLSRLIYGARISVVVGVLGVLVAMVVGVALGFLIGSSKFAYSTHLCLSPLFCWRWRWWVPWVWAKDQGC